MAYTQQSRLLALSTPLGKDALLLTGFTGREGLTKASRFTLDTLSEFDIDPNALIGQPVNFDVEKDDGDYRVFNGIVDAAIPKGVVNKDFRRYQLSIITQVDWLKKKSDNRIFQHKSVRDIIVDVLSEHRVTFIDSTRDTYPNLDYCVQYQETDFQFVHRLLKEAGINYRIKHETGKHTVVLFDHVSHYQKTMEPVIEYVDGGSAKRKFYHWQKTVGMKTGQVSQRSFNFQRPLDPIKSQTQTIVSQPASQRYEHYTYPALHNELSDSDNENRRSMETIENTHTQVKVSTTCRTLEPGHTFSFDRHVIERECACEYVVTTIDYVAVDDTYLNQDGDTQLLESHLRCIPKNILYRPKKHRPRPVVSGTQTAIVCGPTGEEIYTDELGRIKVQFHWDRQGKRDENSSCWVRVAQPWANGGFGGQYLPRIGQEVLVHFEEGDINKPLVQGTVYNGRNKTAFTLPANKTQSGSKSRSSKGADPIEYNELRFEDKKGQEDLHIQAQKNQTTVIKDSETRAIGNEQLLSVGKNKFEIINNSRDTILPNGQDLLQVQKDIAMQSVDGGIVFEAKNNIELEVGGAKICLKKAGHLLLNGQLVNIDGSTKVSINGGHGASAKRLSPMQVKDIFKTPTSGGTAVRNIMMKNETSKEISNPAINLKSREHLEKEAMKHLVDNNDVIQKIMNEKPKKVNCAQLKDAIEQAQLSQSSYRRVDLSQEMQDAGWQEADLNSLGLTDADFINDSTGFKSKLFHNIATDEYTLAFAGTDMTGMSLDESYETLKDGVASMKQGGYGISKQYAQTLDLSRKIKATIGDKGFRTTGHSLGGGLATAAALVTNSESTVFNSSAMTRLFAAKNGLNFDEIPNLVDNFVVDGELLTSMQDPSFTPPIVDLGLLPGIPQIKGFPKLPLPNPMAKATGARHTIPKPGDGTQSSAESHGIAVVIDALKEHKQNNCG